jgi:hypothetical protein
LCDDFDAGIEGADAVYVKSWGSLQAFGRRRRNARCVPACATGA